MAAEETQGMGPEETGTAKPARKRAAGQGAGPRRKPKPRRPRKKAPDADAEGRESASAIKPERESRTSGTPEEAENLEPISRKQLLDRALDLIASDLEKKKRPTNTISSLVQLLKLERALREEEELPQQIRVVWQETDADETDEDENEEADSAGNLPGG